MIRYIVVTGCLFLISCNAFCQDLLADLNKLHEYYGSVDVFNSEMDIQVYNSKDASTPFMKKKALIKKSGSLYYYKVDDTEMFMTDKSLIMVYNTAKKILYRDVDKKEAEALKRNAYTSSLDSTLVSYDSVRYNGMDNNLKKYTIYTSKRMINKTELTINAATGKIEKLTYYYNTRLYKDIYKVTVVFNSLSTDEVFARDFSEQRFISRKEKSIQPSLQYSNFELTIINNDN